MSDLTSCATSSAALHVPQVTICYGMAETSPVSFQSETDDPIELRVSTVGRVLGRGMRLQFRLESFNAFNHTQFSGVSTNIANANFGVVTSARAARINQLGVKFIF
jgi:hypothetical protein